MDALELALRCSSLLMRTMTRDARETGDILSLSVLADEPTDGASDIPSILSLRQQMNDSDCERHFNGEHTLSPQKGTSLKEPAWCAVIELTLLVSGAKLDVQSLV